MSHAETDLLSMPDDPCALLQEWFDLAERDSGMTNHNVMMVATVGEDARPSVRALLHKRFDPATGRIVFFTNYEGRKAKEIDVNPNVAIAMHWDKLERQVRIEGRAERASAEESDDYFASRARDSQIGAWASDQSRPLESWELLIARVFLTANEYADGPVPRPPHWGGYAVIPSTIEFWEGGTGRVHKRLVYTRDADAENGWSMQWLYP